MMAGETYRATPKLFWLKFSIAGGLSAGFLLSRNLWINSRLYPLTPVWSGFSSPSHPFDYCIFALSIVLLVLIAGISRPAKLIAGFVLLAGSMAVLDQSRWQPWFYQYMLMLSAVLLACRAGGGVEQEKRCLDTCRLIVVSVYFWSGIQKANSGFLDNVFPWLIEPVTHLLPVFAGSAIVRAGAVVPLTECGIAIVLLSKKWRNNAVIVAVVMHVFILVELGPVGHNTNSVIWSWNVTMICFLALLFWRSPDFSAMDLVWPKRAKFQKLVLGLCAVAPLLSLFHLWDNYLSWALYAGNKDTAELCITNAVETRLPDEIRDYATRKDEQTHMIDIAEWSHDELNVPPYPELRIYKSIARYMCEYAREPQDVTLVVKNKRALRSGSLRSFFDCASLQR